MDFYFFVWLFKKSFSKCVGSEDYSTTCLKYNKDYLIVELFQAVKIIKFLFLNDSINQSYTFCSSYVCIQSKLFGVCGSLCLCVCVFSGWLLRSPLHFPFAFLLSSIISTTDELSNEFDSKQCLNTSVMAVLTMTPSLGPNLCY